MANKTEDYINEMYDASLESQKAGLEADYMAAGEEYARQQKKNQQQTDANLTRTYIEAEKARRNYNEVENAYGMTSGAMAQARLARDNQLQGDLTAIRAAQQEADAEIERERSLLAKEYEAAIRKAQAENDIARAEALFAQAQKEEERLLAQQENAASMMAGVGEYARLAALYGLTEEELLLLTGGNTGTTAAGAPAAGTPTGSTDGTLVRYPDTEEERKRVFGGGGGTFSQVAFDR